jgi:hypothetical protein
MREKNGNMVAAVLGGAFAESKGMEVWNPINQSVKVITNAIPPEIGGATGTQQIGL